MNLVLLRFLTVAPVLKPSTFARITGRLHRNETGAEEGMNKLLIFALIALPLLMLLYAFGGEIIKLANDSFDAATGSGALDPGRLAAALKWKFVRSTLHCWRWSPSRRSLMYAPARFITL